MSFLPNIAVSTVALLALAPGVAASETPDRWTAELALDVKRVGNVQVSPDGTLVTFEVGVADIEEDASEVRTHLWLATSDGASSFQLTRGDESCTGAAWSPDGEWIAFLSTRGGDKRNLFRIRARGGEAERLTDLKGSASAFAWSPDGTRIAFTMTDPPTEEEEQARKAKNDGAGRRLGSEELAYPRARPRAEGGRHPRGAPAHERVASRLDAVRRAVVRLVTRWRAHRVLAHEDVQDRRLADGGRLGRDGD